MILRKTWYEASVWCYALGTEPPYGAVDSHGRAASRTLATPPHRYCPRRMAYCIILSYSGLNFSYAPVRRMIIYLARLLGTDFLYDPLRRMIQDLARLLGTEIGVWGWQWLSTPA
eukprot:2045360-Rhodomonas_salina.3